jgi:hypothetical protein
MIHKALISTIAVTAAVTSVACGSTNGSASVSGARADNPNRVTNPYFPLKPGTTYHYRGVKDGVPFKDILTVTRRTKTIQGVVTTVVHDRVFERGHLIEDTLDWYGQDAQGNVHYYGEDTKELDYKGRVKTREGSWEAGVDGAKSGLFMPAHPKVGQRYRQEYYKGHAEDWAKIVSVTDGRVTTNEWSGIEKGVLDKKVYKRGVGNILEASIKGGHEYLKLVSVTRD